MSYKTQLYKSVICDTPNSTVFQKLTDLGVEGIELHSAALADLSVEKAHELRDETEKIKLRIHSLKLEADLCDGSALQSSCDKIKKALIIASALGCDRLLLDPGKIEGMAMPNPWEFCTSYNAKTGYIKSADEKNSAQYKHYIQAHNAACDNISSALNQILPEAAMNGITVSLQNTWSNLNVLPEVLGAFVDSFSSHFIGIDFDPGSMLRYRPAEDAIKVLTASRISGFRMRDFVVSKANKNGGLFFPVGQGDVDWPAVRTALDETGYSGWVTIDDVPHYSLRQQIRVLELFFEGELTPQNAERVRKFRSKKKSGPTVEKEADSSKENEKSESSAEK